MPTLPPLPTPRKAEIWLGLETRRVQISRWISVARLSAFSDCFPWLLFNRSGKVSEPNQISALRGAACRGKAWSGKEQTNAKRGKGKRSGLRSIGRSINQEGFVSADRCNDAAAAASALCVQQGVMLELDAVSYVAPYSCLSWIENPLNQSLSLLSRRETSLKRPWSKLSFPP